VETNAGWVVYSGDLRSHGKYEYYTRKFAEAAAGLNPVALIIEGTRIKEEKTYTEQDVRDSSLEAVRSCKSLVIADFGPRNVERLLSFLDITRAMGRELAILPKDAYLLDAMRACAGDQEIPALDAGGFRIYWKYSGQQFKWQKQLREKYERLIVGPKDVSANQDKFICCFSYFDINELVYIKPAPGSVYIYSTCEPFNEEMQIDAAKLLRWIERFGLRHYGRISPNRDTSDDPFHVSGHASGPDLKKMVETIRPKNLIPVHSEHPGDYEEMVGDITNVIIPERGAAIDL
jgi:ribonuclease J